MTDKVNLDKDIFTTFEVASICNANITSIKNWIEKGKLRAFRTPGGHYRIEREILEGFLNRYGMPNPFDTRVRKHVVVFCQNPATVELVRRGVGRDNTVEGTDDPMEAALMIGDRKPDCLIVDLKMEGIDAMRLVRRIREQSSLQRMQIVAFTDTDDVEFEHKALDQGVSLFVRASEGVDTLNERIRDALV